MLRLLTVFYFVVALFCLPAMAQISDIPTILGSDVGVVPTNPAPHDIPCHTCKQLGCRDPECKKNCAECQVDTDFSCSGNSAMSSAGIKPEQAGDIVKAVIDVANYVKDSPNGSQFFNSWQRNDTALSEIFASDKRLPIAVSSLLIQNLDRMKSIKENKSNLTVGEKEIRDFRAILMTISNSKTAEKYPDLVFEIRKTVLPRLNMRLVGKTFKEAIDCFANEACSIK